MALVSNFGVTYIPFHVIIDHTMTIRYAAYGWNERAITDTIALLLAEMATLGVSPGNADAQPLLPDRVTLHPAYPNPFNPSVTITYTLPEAAAAQLEVLDMLGRRVALLVDDPPGSRGRHELLWNAGDLGSGVYVLRLKSAGAVETQKIVLLK